jgi:protocatechuate 3,4-dioxygenase beta subunit
MKMPRVALLLAFIGSTSLAQLPASSSIQGVLVRWGTTEPVEQATVELRNSAGTASVAVTATRVDGRFEFSNLRPGNYRIVAMAPGFATAEYGQLRQNGAGRTIQVSQGERATVQIGIVPGGIISGRITDETGQPMVYSRVRIFRLAYSPEGELSPTVAQETLTNDRGEYRAFWLSPGQYLVSGTRSQLNTFSSEGITDPMGLDRTIPSTFIGNAGRPVLSTPPDPETSSAVRARSISVSYYANATDAQSADIVSLRAGSEATGIDVRITPITARVAPVELRGTVIDAAGAPVQGNYSLLISTWPAPSPTTPANVRPITVLTPSTNPNTAPGAQVWTNDNGRFDGGAFPGSYQIRATRGEFSGRTVLDVGTQDLNVTVQLRPPTSVAGRVVIEGVDSGTSAATPEGLLVGVRTPPASQFFAAVGPDGRFQINNVIVGDYQIYVPPIIPAPAAQTNPNNPNLGVVTGREKIPALENAYVKAIRSGGVDLRSTLLRVEGTEPVPPLEIVIGLKAGSVDGRAVIGNRPVGQATVVLLPQGPPPYQSDRYKSAITDESGRFQFKGIPPGDYRLIAWEDVDSGAWFNAQFLSSYERYAMPLKVEEGQSRTLEVSVIPTP